MKHNYVITIFAYTGVTNIIRESFDEPVCIERLEDTHTKDGYRAIVTNYFVN